MNILQQISPSLDLAAIRKVFSPLANLEFNEITSNASLQQELSQIINKTIENLAVVPLELAEIVNQTTKSSKTLQGNFVDSVIRLLNAEKLHETCIDFALRHEEWIPSQQGIDALDASLESTRIPYQDTTIFESVKNYRLWLWLGHLTSTLQTRVDHPGMNHESLLIKTPWMETRLEFLGLLNPDGPIYKSLEPHDLPSRFYLSTATRHHLSLLAEKNIHDGISRTNPQSDLLAHLANNLEQFDKTFITSPNLSIATDIFSWHAIARTAGWFPKNDGPLTITLIFLAACNAERLSSSTNPHEALVSWKPTPLQSSIWSTILSQFNLGHTSSLLTPAEFSKYSLEILDIPKHPDIPSSLFPNLSSEQAKEIELLTRPYRWKESKSPIISQPIDDATLLQQRYHRHLKLLTPKNSPLLPPVQDQEAWNIDDNLEAKIQQASTSRLSRHLRALDMKTLVPPHTEPTLELPYFIPPEKLVSLK